MKTTNQARKDKKKFKNKTGNAFYCPFASQDSTIAGIQLGTQIYSEDGNFIYHISIIDYLQKFDKFKKGERFYKVNIKGAKSSELSSMESQPYGTRFLEFMKSKVFNFSLNQLEASYIDVFMKN